MKYCIVVLIERAVAAYFKQLSTSISHKFSVPNLSERVPCHITLKYPFEATGEEIEIIKDKVQLVASTKKSIDFTLGEFSHFSNKTIFWSVEPKGSVEGLISGYVSELGEFNEDRKFDKDSYKPHISIVRGLSVEDFNLVWDYVKGLPGIKVRGIIDNISILVEKDKTWNIADVFYFK